jgi:hypothetical protein
MEVAEEEDFSRFLRLLHHQLGVIVNWVKLCARSDPLTVQVLADERATIVTYNYTIRI